MEPGHIQLQLAVSSLVIVGCAAIALICDFLKRNNEQLRELTIELKTRHEEEQKRSHLLAPRPGADVVPQLAVAHVVTPNVANPLVAVAKAGAGKDRKRTVNSEALAAMERGAALAGSGGSPHQAGSKTDVMRDVIIASRQGQEMVTPSAVRKDWRTLLNRSAHGRSEAGQAAAAATDHSSLTQASELVLPAGFQDGFVLNKLVQNQYPVSGLVVSIGVKASGTLPRSVQELMQTLIGPQDFAAQSSDEEFLLIYPRERGASAQRRLSQIAQQLWDFQLRSLGSFQILFSWGGVEVRSESIEDAIASASERMRESKRGRKLLTMSAPAPEVEKQLRQAV